MVSFVRRVAAPNLSLSSVCEFDLNLTHTAFNLGRVLLGSAFLRSDDLIRL